MSDNFCALKAKGVDTVQATVISLTYVQDKYGGDEVRRVIKQSKSLAPLALGAAAAKCPSYL